MKNTNLIPKKNKKAKINYGPSIIPSFWLYLGIISILGCLGFYGYRYWQITTLTQKQDDRSNLETSKYNDNINSNVVTRDQLSPEDLSIAADLDNIDVILKEMEENTIQQNFIPVKNISKKRNKKPAKFSSKIESDFGSNLLNSTGKNKTNVPLLYKTINDSSIQKVVEPSSTKSQTSLLSNSQDAIATDNNLSDFNLPSTNRSLRSIGKLYNQNQNFKKQGLTTSNPQQSNTINPSYSNNLNGTSNQNNWRSPSASNEGFIPISGQTNQSSVVGNSGTSNNFNSTRWQTGDLRNYQIQLQDYNRLVPRDYLAVPRTGSQLNQIQNNGQSRVEASGVPLNNLSNYQLKPQGLNQFNPPVRSFSPPNTANLSQPNTFSTNNNQSNSNNFNNSGLQPSGTLQPSNSLVIDH